MGGMRESGMGRRQGSEGIHRYTESQSVATQRLIRFAPMLGMSDETYAKVMTAQPAPDEEAGTGLSWHGRRGSTSTSWSIGSGFGGSVTALRLTEKGYRVGVHRGRRAVRGRGLRQGHLRPQAYLCGAGARHATASSASTPSATRMIVAGAGVGGGSLVYANTLYEPLQAFYNDPQWRDITDWKAELAPYYDQAKRMLGVVENPVRTPSDEVMEKVADDMGVGRHLPPDPGRRLLRRPRPGGRRGGRRPVLRRRGARPAIPASTAASA